MPDGAELRYGDDDGVSFEARRDLDIFDAFAENAILQPTGQRLRIRLTQAGRIRRIDEVRRRLILLSMNQIE